MNAKLTKDEFFEIITVFIVEEAKATGKNFVGEDPADLTEYQQLLAHIAKFPMKTPLKMVRYRVEPKEKLLGRRLIDSMEKSDTVRLIV
jgi:hypothetical protein